MAIITSPANHRLLGHYKEICPRLAIAERPTRGAALIMYNHHRTGPAGTVLFAPPFRDPFNFFFDPMIPIGLNLVGAAIHDRFAAEGKRGATMLEGSSYSTWFNGGLRTTTYFHNMIGLLTETIGSPTPMQVNFVPHRLLPNKDTPYPGEPGQTWHFRQSIEYSV